MIFHPLSITNPHIIYACLGGFVVMFGMFSLFIREKLYIGEACWAFLFGVIIGPYGANLIDPRVWAGNNGDADNTITLEFTRVVLAIGVFAIGVELPKAYMARHWKSLFFLLFPVMTWGWFVSAGLIYAFIPGMTFLCSLAVAACLTPTDPILAAAVVGGKYADKHVPAHIRHLLAAESGCNDGAAYPFLFISLYLILEATPGAAVRDWFLFLWLYQILLSVVFGSLIGFGFRHLMKFCERNDLIDRQSYVAQYVSLAFLTIGIMTMLGSDDLLAAFCCGTAFAWDGFFNRQTAESVFSSVIDLLFNVAAFIYVGAWMPFDSFTNATLKLSVWRLIVIAILVLLLRRLPIMIMLYKFIPDVKTFREAVFSGHFGPIGIGAVYISTLAVEMLPKPNYPPTNQTEFLALTIQPIVSFMVLCSVATHGLSIPFFSLSRRVHSVSSRTWSRHAAADWTSQARLVARPEDIVINRDRISEMEKGEAAESSGTASKRTSVATAVPPVVTDIRSTDVVEEDKVSPSGTLTAEECIEENPPDGSETELEWREGPHKVIERRRGPGQEVEIEVVRNAYDTQQKSVSSFFRGQKHAVIQSVHDHLQGLQHAAECVEGGLKEISGTVKRDICGTEERILHDGNNGATSPADGADGEEEWLSDRSDGDTGTGSTAGQHGDRRKRPRSGDVKSALKHTGSHRRTRLGGKTRRRASIASTGEDSVKQPAEQDPAPTMRAEQGQEAEGHRGRSVRSERPNTDHAVRRSLKHRRLESLKLDPVSRDVSPARSVRFADEGARSGTITPRSFSANDQWHQSPADDDSSKGRVTFDVPHQT